MANEDPTTAKTPADAGETDDETAAPSPPVEAAIPRDAELATNGDRDRNGHANGSSTDDDGNNHSATRLSHAELRQRFFAQTQGQSCLIAEPLDSGLWPTAGLSDRQVELLTGALRKVRRHQLDSVDNVRP